MSLEGLATAASIIGSGWTRAVRGGLKTTDPHLHTPSNVCGVWTSPQDGNSRVTRQEKKRVNPHQLVGWEQPAML